MSIVTADEVRSVSGAPTELKTDTEINNIISLVESKIEDLFDIALTPKKRIETLKGEYKEKILVSEYFPLTVYKVLNGSSEIDVKNIYVNTESGLLELYGDSISSGFPYAGNRFSQYDLDVKVKYLFGMMQRDNSIQTEIITAVSSGSNVEIEVTDSSDFTIGDYVFIEDTNRAKEVFKITAISDSTHITAEILVNNYESEGLITKAKTQELFKQYVLYESAITVGINAIGGTYTIATSYSAPEYTVTKGVPYPHWQKNTEENIKQRNILLERIRSLLGTLA